MKFFNKIMLIVAAAATMVACQKEETFAPSKSVKLTVNAEAEALQNDTRTYIDNTNTILWGAEESMTVSCYDVAAASSHFATATTTEYADQSKASFTFEFTGLNAESTNFVLGGVYPTAACVSSDLVSAFKVSLPAKQSATANSYDPAAYIMVAQPVEVSTLPESLMMTYRRATALNKVTLTGIDDDIVSVTITAPADVVLAGRRYFNLAEGASNEIYYGQTNEITVSYNEALVGGYDMDVWFTSWESSIAEGAELTICAKSETTSYTRTITANANGISFKEGFLNLLTVNMAADDVVVETVASYEGNYVAAVKVDGTYYALSVEANGTRQAAVAINSWNVVNGICYTEDSNIAWNIAKTDEGYTMSNGTNYLMYDSTDNKNIASVSSTPYYLTIEDNTAEEGTVTIASKNLAARILQFNKDQRYFAFYTSTQISAFYLLQPMADTRTALDTPNVTAQVADIKNIVVSWENVSGAASYVVSFNGVPQTTEGTEVTFEGVDNTTYDISVMAIPTDTENFKPSTGVATVTTGANPEAASGTVTYDFTAIPDFSTWTKSYVAHEVEYTEGKVIFSKANRQTETITNMPVTKGQPVEFKLTNGATLTKAELVCKQWTTKAQTITMHYSTDGGNTYTTTGVTSNTFTISNDALPAGTNALKFTFSSSSNQIGIQSLEIAYE